MRSLLFEVKPADPATLAVTTLFLLFIGLCACDRGILKAADAIELGCFNKLKQKIKFLLALAREAHDKGAA